MKFCLVSPPTVTEFNKTLAESEAILSLAEHAPVGILTLAAVLDQEGLVSDILDTNQLYYEYLRAGHADIGGFADHIVRRLIPGEYDAIGFGTICSSYPLTLRIVEAYRAIEPRARLILGGPQASVVDLATMAHFPTVDFIVRFEAEHSLPMLLRAIAADADISTVPGVTWRRGGQVTRTPNAPVIDDLDTVPTPAFARYPYLRQARYIPLELGRGCPYGCAFCSTNDFFRRRYRLKSPSVVVRQMSELKAEYNVGIFDLIHDMFTVNRSKVVEFCEAILDSGEEFYWNCSARTDRVDAELLDLMQAAGCRGIFFGIETGSQSLQMKIKKRLILPDALASLRATSDRGIQAAASLITGFPDESEDDFADTVDFFVESLRSENVDPQLHILAPLADTPIHQEYQDRLVFDDIMSDMSHQGWNQDIEDRQLIGRFADVFPNFYAVPTPLDRVFLKEMRGFLLTSAKSFRWLLIGIQQYFGDTVQVFKQFQAWRPSWDLQDPELKRDGVPYFQTKPFRVEFLRFVEECLVTRSPSPAGLSALVRYARYFEEIYVDDPRADLELTSDGQLKRIAFSATSRPRLAPYVQLIDIDVDFADLMERLRSGRSLTDVSLRTGLLASRKLPGRWPEVIQLSPLSAALLRLCDCGLTVDEIIKSLTDLRAGPAGIPPAHTALIGLELLRCDALIEDGPNSDEMVAAGREPAIAGQSS